MINKTPTPFILTSIKLTPEFYKLAKQHSIKFTEAIRVGLSIMLAEKGVIEYDNNLNISRKIILLRENLEKVSNELNYLKSKQ